MLDASRSLRATVGTDFEAYLAPTARPGLQSGSRADARTAGARRIAPSRGSSEEAILAMGMAAIEGLETPGDPLTVAAS